MYRDSLYFLLQFSKLFNWPCVLSPHRYLASKLWKEGQVYARTRVNAIIRGRRNLLRGLFITYFRRTTRPYPLKKTSRERRFCRIQTIEIFTTGRVCNNYNQGRELEAHFGRIYLAGPQVRPNKNFSRSITVTFWVDFLGDGVEK